MPRPPRGGGHGRRCPPPAGARRASAGPRRRGRTRLSRGARARARKRDRHPLPGPRRVAARRPRGSRATHGRRDRRQRRHSRFSQQPRPAAARYGAARQNLARALATQGHFSEGWTQYRWRLLAQGLSNVAPDPDRSPLPASLGGRRFVLRAEQGLGDILFFLRFAPELARRGAQLAFHGDARLHSMLDRTGLFALGLAADEAAAPTGETLYLGDLPWLLEANDPARFPPPLALAPDAAPAARAQAALEAVGPHPRIALTWRGGVASKGPARTQLKEIDLERRGPAVRGIPAPWHSGLAF